jgi:beta-lactamase superfamily II metal-dependent hydrolase
MAVFKVEALPASFGDALWIEYGQKDDIHHVLIDGGLAGTFSHIESKIKGLKDPRKLDLLMVTHVDEDHIAGTVKLLGAVQDLNLDFDDVWFNGREHLEGKRVVLDKLGSKQGEFLAALIEKQTVNWNKAFGGLPVEISSAGALPSCTLAGGMRLTILSPGRAQLKAMIKKWDTELANVKTPVDWADVEAVIAFLEKQQTLKPKDSLGGSLNVQTLAETPFDRDTSKANGTSIAVLAEFGDRSVLFGADAYAPVLSASIDRLIKERALKRLRVDLFKVPHHGSAGNLSLELLKKLECRNYLVSTNGERHEHPDHEAIARIVCYGGPKPVLHFNYRSPFNELWDDDDMGQGASYDAKYPAKGKEGCVINVASLPR